jgi:outer membrane protein TolC
METEIQLLEEELETTQRKINDKREMLKVVLNSENMGTISDSITQYLTQSEGKLPIEELVQRNPQLKALLEEAVVWEEKVELSKNSFLPDFTIGAAYIQTGDAPGMADSGKDPWMINAGVTLPIFVGKTFGKIERAKVGAGKIREMYTQVENNLNQMIVVSLNAISEAQRKILLYNNEIIPKIEKSISVQENQFSVGKMDFMQLLDDYRMLLKMQLLVHKAQKSEFQSKAKVLWIGGDINAVFSFPNRLTVSATGKE